MKKRILILFAFAFLMCIDKVIALEVGQKLEDGQIIESINDIDISIKGRKSNLQNFLSDKWRTYVKLGDLCSSEIGICEIEEINNTRIVLIKNYEGMQDVYYRTVYNYNNNTYKSLLMVPNSLNFSFGDTMTSPDVIPLEIDDELYVPIRFITESLGAEVIYENKKEDKKATVTIDFYSNMNLDFNVNFYDSGSAENNDYSTREKYNFKDLKEKECYDIVANVGNKTIYNPKLFSQNENFVTINYNNNAQTNICLNNNPSNKSLSFVFNYNGVPLLYNVNGNTVENPTLDKLYLTGNTSEISKDNEVKLEVKYSGTELNFEKYATLKWQGSSSIAYEKKNYTIKLFNDERYTNKYKISINNWDERNKYVLKANYVDYTQARNIVSAKLWGQVVKSRKNISNNLKKLVNGGAIDGYPVELYINGEYYGLYTFNTAKDEDLFNMNKDDELLIASDSYKDDSLFKNIVDFSDSNTGWETIYTGNKTDEEVENSINKLINFTINNDGKSLKNGLSNYLDVDAAIDYLIYMYYICAADNSAKNMLWATLNSKVWFPSAYDLDSTFGNGEENWAFYNYDVMLPSINSNGTVLSNTPNGMILWTKLLNNYGDEIKIRYNELRKNILTSSNVIKLFEQFKNQIPDEVYDNNLNRWPNLPNSKDDNYNLIYQFIKQREIKLDEIMNML